MNLWHCLFLLHLVLASECPQYLTATAVVEDARGSALLECWRFTSPFYEYPTVGMAHSLANVSNITYVAIPPRSSEGIHKPPHPMIFVLLSGLAHVTLPDSDEEAWIMEGVNGLLVAADVSGFGHYTDYPSDKTTIALQVPFKDGHIPDHAVVHRGACRSASQVTPPCSQAASRDPWLREEL
ncbi:uncharacterized protein BDW43DRAFT_263333 [Aspergillus alliaceus]|uniref:uncharacterized protein n=1 Tax=Petromyces alliaceus TaxID=209559 RepID=UPI0012A44238|nr:uncharacterized protein BDW43DRAFT_263333 [Aspergillus alliaceus]KAB8238248.1 hypothetical protein BDW43DRAFT_263333 [Aspergillus alliaceus]